MMKRLSSLAIGGITVTNTVVFERLQQSRQKMETCKFVEIEDAGLKKLNLAQLTRNVAKSKR